MKGGGPLCVCVCVREEWGVGEQRRRECELANEEREDRHRRISIS